MPSIVDPSVARNGAATVTRNLLQLLEAPPLSAEIECVPIPRSTEGIHRVRQAAAITRSLVSDLPAKVAYTYSRDYRDRVLALLDREAYDLVVINGSDLLWLEPLLPRRIPRVLVAHNIEHQLFASQLDQLPTMPVVRQLAQRERERLERFELDGLRRTGNVLFLSTVDASHARDTGIPHRAIVVPPMFGEAVVRQPRPVRDGHRLELGFIGNLRWWPNRDALAWFAREVLAHLQRPAHLHVFGEGQRDGVELPRMTHHGPAPNVAHVWTRCDLMVCPMQSGGGVSIKLAEAVFHGRPVLATSFATRGLPLGQDAGLVVRDGATSWIRYLEEVDVGELREQRIAEELSQPFTFGAHRDRVQSFMRHLVQPAAGARIPRERSA